MTFAYYAGPEAVKRLQKFNEKGEKVTKNALKKLAGVLQQSGTSDAGRKNNP